MAKIKLIEEPDEVYFKTTTNYKLEVDGKPLLIRIEEDSNESCIHYWYVEEGKWDTNPPEWIIKLGADEWDDLIFERTMYEYKSLMLVNEEISTVEE